MMDDLRLDKLRSYVLLNSMDELQYYILLNSISVISGLWDGGTENALCNRTPLTFEKILALSGD